MTGTAGNAHAGFRIEIQGTVQGVGFRPWVYRLAREEGLTGRVANDGVGVTIEAFGPPHALEAFLARLEEAAPPAAEIRRVAMLEIPVRATEAFVIDESEGGGEFRLSIPPDLPTCQDCLTELFDPGNRRHRYPFLNCTSCGPRFTIATAVPYDRGATTMAGFAMCPACLWEYQSPSDRRFHAQPNACPECGPRLSALDGQGRALSGDPLAAAVWALEAGFVVAVKGLGGFHLACDATSSQAVLRLRERKRRDEKPLAVMARDLAAAEALADLTTEERRLLVSSERPIVLSRLRRNAAIADEVAPGSPLVGLLLPYTPLHHLLLGRPRGAPGKDAGRAAAPPSPESQAPFFSRGYLVMTSGNLSDEPIAHRDLDALARLSGVADVFLSHNREIANACDDSVARAIGGSPVLLRRARGYVPTPIALRRAVAAPVLACGAHLKNTFCIAASDLAYLGPHLGDLEGESTFARYQESIEHMQRLLGFAPEVVTHDLHPGYQSTAYALSLPNVQTVGVQHHHAHLVSAMAEHGLSGPVLGFAYDGTGYGADGTSWGGDLLVADETGFERLATFRPIALAGGDSAVRQIWRIGLSLLADTFGEDAPFCDFPLFDNVDERERSVVSRMLERRVNAPLAHGVGRLFDGFAALFLGRREARYEGQAALEWNVALDPKERGVYPFELDLRETPWVLDTRPMVQAAVEDFRAGRRPGMISARFHNTLAEATGALAAEAAARVGRLPVVFSGGCFQNPRLSEGAMRCVSASLAGATVFRNRRVPPGDGGLSLGQAIVADAVLRSASKGGA